MDVRGPLRTGYVRALEEGVGTGKRVEVLDGSLRRADDDEDRE